ncbi:DUF4097 family beta strand repeat-containing protein [Streptomyces sp. NPDC018019]|uniref:DUF4097 family beta strand repeat-containing protein n=1 Tax=Streptomyces sp. NPDC018019 TaxID=3365030 RepID=UPI00379DE23B
MSGLGACGVLERSTYEDDARLSAAPVKSIRLDSHSGGLTLRGKKSLDTVSVHRKLRYQGDRPEKATHRVENGVLVLGDCGDDCSVHYTVEVPAGLPVTGKTSSGAVELSDVGAVRVSTTSGAVTLDGVAGAVDVRTTNGGVRGRGLKGDGVRAQTSNGAIDLVTDTPQDVQARTTNGAVTLTVPGGQRNRYRISTKTDNGGKNIGLPDDPSGAHRLDLTTTNGAITIKEG